MKIVASKVLLVLLSLTFANKKDPSIYLLNSIWTNQDGVKIKLESLAGKARLVTMVYTSCQYTCPLAVEELRKIYNFLDTKSREKIGIVLFSFDSEKDTPVRMKAFATQKHLEEKTWTLLSSAPENVQELAVAFGVRFKKTDSNEYSHSNVFLLLDQKGKILYRINGFGQNPKESAAKISGLLNGSASNP